VLYYTTGSPLEEKNQPDTLELPKATERYLEKSRSWVVEIKSMSLKYAYTE
jgi:hypothetical protein